MGCHQKNWDFVVGKNHKWHASSMPTIQFNRKDIITFSLLINPSEPGFGGIKYIKIRLQIRHHLKGQIEVEEVSNEWNNLGSKEGFSAQLVGKAEPLEQTHLSALYVTNLLHQKIFQNVNICLKPRHIRTQNNEMSAAETSVVKTLADEASAFEPATLRLM